MSNNQNQQISIKKKHAWRNFSEELKTQEEFNELRVPFKASYLKSKPEPALRKTIIDGNWRKK